MKPVILPECPEDCFEELSCAKTSPATQKWQSNLYQASRQWLRNDGDIILWLRDFSKIRMHILQRVWENLIPELYQSQVSYLALGSTARGEDVLASDLDYAVLFHASDKGPTADALQPHLYAFIHAMSKFGFPPCDGFVMGTNPRWSGTLPQWQERVEHYFSIPHWEHVRYLFMMIDSAPLSVPLEQNTSNPAAGTGASSLPALASQQWEHLRTYVARQVSLSEYLCWEMAHLGIHNTVAVPKSLGNLFSHQPKSINIKTGLLNPVIHSLRLLAIADDITALSSLGRLEALSHKVIDRSLAKRIRVCLEYGWRQRILTSLEHPIAGEPNDEVLIHKLSPDEQELLWLHLATAKELERLVHRRFRKPR